MVNGEISIERQPVDTMHGLLPFGSGPYVSKPSEVA